MVVELGRRGGPVFMRADTAVGAGRAVRTVRCSFAVRWIYFHGSRCLRAYADVCGVCCCVLCLFGKRELEPLHLRMAKPKVQKRRCAR